MEVRNASSNVLGGRDDANVGFGVGVVVEMGSASLVGWAYVAWYLLMRSTSPQCATMPFCENLRWDGAFIMPNTADRLIEGD